MGMSVPILEKAYMLRSCIVSFKESARANETRLNEIENS